MNIEEVIRLRIRIKDPAGYPKFVLTSVPANPDELTCYRAAEDEYYNSDGERLKLYISDATLDALIAAYGDGAECRCYQEIAKNLGAEMRIKRLTTGTETAEYQTLIELYNFYRSLANECKAQANSDLGNDTGRIGQMKQPTICGGFTL
ncbi:MAG: hypothetical protein AB7D24_11885 [Sphaerochaeta sp.]|uniref:hypothetical protein n=1 Tax=Sphaerochaeta sp. TaxID=1972642 RepID=UPI003D0B3728